MNFNLYGNAAWAARQCYLKMAIASMAPMARSVRYRPWRGQGAQPVP
ncbi:hypothetical protein [Paraburkholderia sediminicola]|nr:hypothetical protein [Paraburkholderia sediminicola]